MIGNLGRSCWLVILVGVLAIAIAPMTARADVLADSMAEFSGVQGQDSWSYGFYDRTADVDDVYQSTDFQEFSTTGTFPGFGLNEDGDWDYLDADGISSLNPPWTTLSPTGGHPNGTNNTDEHWAVRRWVVEKSGDLQINYDLDTAGWTNSQLFLNGDRVLVRTIPGVQPRMQESVALLNVTAGDVLDFIIDPNGNDGVDTTVLQMTIEDQISGGRLLEGIVHASSVADFSFAGVQGENGWTNGYYNVTVDTTSEDGVYQTDDFTPFPDTDFNGTMWD